MNEWLNEWMYKTNEPAGGVDFACLLVSIAMLRWTLWPDCVVSPLLVPLSKSPWLLQLLFSLLWVGLIFLADGELPKGWDYISYHLSLSLTDAQ